MLLRSMDHIRHSATVGNGGATWGSLRALWWRWLPKRLTTRRSRLTLPTSQHTARPQAYGSKRGRGRLIGRTKGVMNTKLHAATDTIGRPIRFFMTAGQVSDFTGAGALVSSLPEADWPLGDRGYDADWFREALVDMGITPCIPGRKSRDKTIKYDKRRYKRRNRIEIMFGRLKDWRRVATRHDRCPKELLSTIALAATVIFWLCVLSLAIFWLREGATNDLCGMGPGMQKPPRREPWRFRKYRWLRGRATNDTCDWSSVKSRSLPLSITCSAGFENRFGGPLTCLRIRVGTDQVASNLQPRARPTNL